VPKARIKRVAPDFSWPDAAGLTAGIYGKHGTRPKSRKFPSPALPEAPKILLILFTGGKLRNGPLKSPDFREIY
jgi:hypothetical protein